MVKVRIIKKNIEIKIVMKLNKKDNIFLKLEIGTNTLTELAKRSVVFTVNTTVLTNKFWYMSIAMRTVHSKNKFKSMRKQIVKKLMDNFIKYIVNLSQPEALCK